MSYLLSALAVYRLSRMIALEEGPFSVFSKLQEMTVKQDTWIERGLNCPACLGWWISLLPAFWIARQEKRSLFEFLLIWQGIAGGAFVLFQRAR